MTYIKVFPFLTAILQMSGYFRDPGLVITTLQTDNMRGVYSMSVSDNVLCCFRL